MESRGIRVDDKVVHPRIAIGTVTGCVTYSAPLSQGMPEAERLRRLGPVVAGRLFVRVDYGQIEPRLLHALLRRRGAIPWDAGEDLYRTLRDEASGDRAAIKVIVNTVINSGRPTQDTTGRLAEFIQAAGALRAKPAAEAKAIGTVRTLAGRDIPLPPAEVNHAGKAVNRVMRGTAADIFHRAILSTDRIIHAERLPAAVAFLLFDEVWVEADPAAIPRVEHVLRVEMQAAGTVLGIELPVRISTGNPG
jgi:hypothetical protein